MAFVGVWRYRSALFAFLALSGSSARALADGSPEAAHGSRAADKPPDDVDAFTERRIAALRRQRDSIHRAAPITLLVVGGVVGVVSLELTALKGLSGMSESSTSPPSSSLTGFYVASGVGFAAALAGLIWLINCNQRRGELEDRIEKLRQRSAFVLPTLDPKTGTTELTFTVRF